MNSLVYQHGNEFFQFVPAEMSGRIAAGQHTKMASRWPSSLTYSYANLIYACRNKRLACSSAVRKVGLAAKQFPVLHTVSVSAKTSGRLAAAHM
jgi:hypothetical protein